MFLTQTHQQALLTHATQTILTQTHTLTAQTPQPQKEHHPALMNCVKYIISTQKYSLTVSGYKYFYRTL